MSAVHAEDLFQLYRAAHGDVAALRGLSLEVPQGETVAVLGPTGSGKTTLLNLCAGLQRPSSGTLTVLGRRFDRLSPREAARVRRRSIGIVRQHYHRALPRELTVEEIIAFPLRLRGALSQDDRRRVQTLVRLAGLERRAGARPDELSGGEQQRVALCAAVAKRPSLVLADEPTGELDAAATAAVVELLIELAHESGAAALIVTHDEAVANATARTIHIRDGRLAAEGTARPVLIVDEQGWVRLPQTLRERAGVTERVRARATWGKVELHADDPVRRDARAEGLRLDPVEKRATEAAFDRVTRRYGSDTVLRELSWTVAAERLHVIVGPSGSGKTTLLNFIAALDYPDDGAVWVGGERVDALRGDAAARFRAGVIGYASQHSTVVDFLTARENVELALTLRGFGASETSERATRWLDALGLGSLADRRGGSLSGGEQRRVTLARALAPLPRVLLVDEPTAHLDRVSARSVIRLLRDVVRESGITVVAATHDVDLVGAADERLLLTSPS